MQINRLLISNPSNYTKGRHANDGSAINTIIVHTYGGKGESLFSWFQNNSRKVSSHYAVLKNGSIEQYVDDSDTSHATGHNWYNAHGISIEFQDDGNPSDSVRTSELYESGSQLIFSLCLKYNIPINSQRVTTHKAVLAELNVPRECPGNLDVNRLITRASILMNEYNKLKALVDNQTAELDRMNKDLVAKETIVENQKLLIKELATDNEILSAKLAETKVPAIPIEALSKSVLGKLYLLFNSNESKGSIT